MALGCFSVVSPGAKEPQLSQFYGSLEQNVCDACAHGSQRDKRTKWLSSTPGVFHDMALDCPGDHVHASWQAQLVEISHR